MQVESPLHGSALFRTRPLTMHNHALKRGVDPPVQDGVDGDSSPFAGFEVILKRFGKVQRQILDALQVLIDLGLHCKLQSLSNSLQFCVLITDSP